MFQLVHGDTGYWTDKMDTRLRRISRAASNCQLWRMSGLVSLVDEFLQNQGSFLKKYFFNFKNIDTAKNIAAAGLRSACYGHLLCVEGMRKVIIFLFKKFNLKSNVATERATSQWDHL